MWSVWPWSFLSPPTWVIHRNHNQCLKYQVTSQRAWVTTESHKSPICHCGWSTVLASCLLTLPYKLEPRELPLLLLLKELFLGCPHFPLPGLAAVYNDSALLTCNCLPAFFFFFKKRDFQLIFLHHLVSEKLLNNPADFSSAFGSLHISESRDAQSREN